MFGFNWGEQEGVKNHGLGAWISDDLLFLLSNVEPVRKKMRRFRREVIIMDPCKRALAKTPLMSGLAQPCGGAKPDVLHDDTTGKRIDKFLAFPFGMIWACWALFFPDPLDMRFG